MRKASIITASLLALVGTLAVAAPPMFKAATTFNDDGLTLTVAGSLSGLPSGDLEFKLSATGTETVVCGVPGVVDPPPAEVVLAGSKVVTVPANGGVGGTFADLASLAPAAPACPQADGEAIAAQHDIAFTKASIEIRPVQLDPALPPAKTVRCIQCTFKAPTIDGPAKPQQCLTLSAC
ncbi:hypothetical protein [Nannocystis bainbridge]|uniref:Uncharacterized protein n=1 Tax=Nannocystis bainbridge TaxID=2995303 RepID=A0ABT5E8V4_9BACT|nr:hypothetical protein [Nannocystis bainbridge]MDC0722291.1 hypothetical protein [Nannocystis bainbridge]